MGETDVRDRLAQIRTLLAAERTFSAWIRTGLAGVGGGLVIVKLIPFHQVAHQRAAHTAGQLLVIWGAAIFIFAVVDYWTTYKRLEIKDASTALPISITVITALLFVAVAFILWTTFTVMGP